MATFTSTPTIKPLTPCEQDRRDMVLQSNGLLQECWAHDKLYAVELVGERRVTVDLTSFRGRKGYQVMWQSEVDRKVKGVYKATTCFRSRSFKHFDKMINFLRTF